MSRRLALLTLILSLAADGAAEAQYGGGMGGGMSGGGLGGGGGGRHGGERPRQDQGDAPRPAAPAQIATGRQANLAKVMIDGVITRIDTSAGRVTIAYDEVDALNWPRGTMAFGVERSGLLNGLSVGQKVRFHVESQTISAIEPIDPSGSPGTR